MHNTMQKNLIFILTVLLSLASISCSNSQTRKTFPRKAYLDYLKKLRSDSLVIIGQHAGDADVTAQGYQDYVEDLALLTGSYPALVGFEYGMSPNIDLHYINQFAIEHWKKGGWVTICWHADNPFTEGYSFRWNSIEKKDSIDLLKLLKSAPDSKARRGYRAELAKVGAALKELNDAGVPVFWRPFHEMNGSWFWWGTNNFKNPTNTKAYRLLWEDMYNYFTKELGLENLIWIYGPFASAEWVSSFDAFYPGDENCDIVGVDIYTKTPVFMDYEAMVKYNKPLVIAEIGPSNDGYGNFNGMDVLKTLRGKASWFLQWSSWKGARVAIVDNPFSKEFMSNQAAVTLDKIKTFK